MEKMLELVKKSCYTSKVRVNMYVDFQDGALKSFLGK